MDRKEELLKNKFGFSEFKPGQVDTLDALEKGNDVLSVLPTGAGKSLIYQLYGYLINKTVLVVSPLLSLMSDQVSRMNYLGEKKVVALNSTKNWAEKRHVLRNIHKYRFIFISPEMLANQTVIEALSKIELGLMVIDEAHCISKWGLDFRPEYLNLKNVIISLKKPQMLMLTATADHKVQDDIIHRLGLTDVTKVIENVNRKNIYLAVKELADDEDKKQYLLELLKDVKLPGIIYFSSKKKADEIAELISNKLKVPTSSYHAGLTNDERFKIQHQFMAGNLQIICATSAFGMGIDKNDVRFVIHYHLPQDMESYVQEIGRAGRDGKQSIAVLLFAKGDDSLARNLTKVSIPSDLDIDDYFVGDKDHIDSQKKRLLEYYKEHDYSPNEVKKVFSEVSYNKDKNLKQVLAFIKIRENCRRKYLLGLFDEKFQDHDAKCCDFGRQEFSLKQLELFSEKVHYTLNKDYNWQEILDKLFE